MIHSFVHSFTESFVHSSFSSYIRSIVHGFIHTASQSIATLYVSRPPMRFDPREFINASHIAVYHAMLICWTQVTQRKLPTGMRSSWRVPGLSTDTTASTVTEETLRGFVRPRRHLARRAPRQLTEQSCDIDRCAIPSCLFSHLCHVDLGHIYCIFPFCVA